MILFYTLLLLATASAAGALLSLKSRPARARLARLADGTRAPEIGMAPGLTSESVPPWLMKILSRATPRSLEDDADLRNRLRKRLLEGGYRRPSAITVFLGSRTLLAIALPLFAVLMPASWNLERAHMLLVVLGASAVGYIAPGFWVDRRRSHRQLQMRNALPDALDLMVVCVQAGLGVVASLDRVVRDLGRSHPILASEFDIAIREIRAGRTTSEALRRLALRTGVEEMNALVAMLVQTERFGGSVSETLRVHADALRVRRMQRAEELANKAPLKMLLPTTLIFFATLVVSIGPAVIRILGMFER